MNKYRTVIKKIAMLWLAPPMLWLAVLWIRTGFKADQCRSGSESGSREKNQCGSRRIRILVRFSSLHKVELLHEK